MRLNFAIANETEGASFLGARCWWEKESDNVPFR